MRYLNIFIYNSVSDNMALSQFRSKRKSTGGLYKRIRKKKKRDFGSDFIPVKLGPKNKKVVEGLANIRKQRLLQIDAINVTDPKTGKTENTKILEVLEHLDNPHYTRSNVITKGCIVKTELGKVKVTSRPSQHGVVNGIIVEEKK
jgi:small subunit ribosomal protein S8e